MSDRGSTPYRHGYLQLLIASVAVRLRGPPAASDALHSIADLLVEARYVAEWLIAQEAEEGVYIHGLRAQG